MKKNKSGRGDSPDTIQQYNLKGLKLLAVFALLAYIALTCYLIGSRLSGV